MSIFGSPNKASVPEIRFVSRQYHFFVFIPNVSSKKRYATETYRVNFDPPAHDAFPKQPIGILEYKDPLVLAILSAIIERGDGENIGHLVRIRDEVCKTGQFVGRYRYVTRVGYAGGGRYAYLGLQPLSREARKIAPGDASKFIDIDIVKAHPSFAAQVVRRYGAHAGLVAPFLEEYVGNRDETLAIVCESYTYIEGGWFISMEGRCGKSISPSLERRVCWGGGKTLLAQS